MPIPSHDWAALSRLLDTALAMPAEERGTWIEGLGEDCAPLKGLLRDLLSREDLVETGSFLATLPKIAAGDLRSRTDAAAGDRIGPYRLVQMLGTGGMGSVWLAERTDGLLNRRVAIKLPHVSGPLADLTERMARERNILAALEHPNIARLYDAGIANDGRPYLALEYVEGEPVSAYCRKRHLDIRGRVELVIQIARAVAYAHARLVVHRDLKPSNILVDAQGRVHLLDFGIAKLLDSGVPLDAQITQFAGSALTPDYASPEQVRGTAVGTASDVYSLGVVLYELLAGVRPHKRASASDALSLAQAVVSEVPPRPSDAAQPPAERKELRGDLDTIVLKALKKLPDERYPTVAEMADDLERYLRHEPVRAQPDSFWYRSRKFVGRNKLGVTAALAVSLALIVGTGVALWQARVAKADARTAHAVEQFMESVFRTNSAQRPDPAQARATTATELLRMGASTLDESLKDVPEAKLRVLGTLADMHDDLALYDDAVVLNRERVELARSLYGPDDVRVVDTLLDLSKSMIGSKVPSERQGVLELALAILDRAGDTKSRRRADLLGELTELHSDLDQPKALTLAKQRVQLERQMPPSASLMEALLAQGWLETQLKQDRDAEVSLTEAVKVSKAQLGERNSQLPRAYAYLAEPQLDLQEYAAAEASLRSALEISRDVNGPADASTIQVESRLGLMLSRSSRVREGVKLLGDASAMMLKTRGAEDPLYVPMMAHLYGRSLAQMGRLEEALATVAPVSERWRRLQPDTTYLMQVLETEAGARVAIGDLANAERILDEALVIRKKSGAPSGVFDENLTNRVALLLARERGAEAAALLSSPRTEIGGASSLAPAAAREWLVRAEVEFATGAYVLARQDSEHVLTVIGADSQKQFLLAEEARASLDEGRALQRLGEHEQAATLLKRAADLDEQLYDAAMSPLLADALVAWADCLIDLNRFDEARVAAARAQAIQSTHPRLGPQYVRSLKALQARLRAA